MEARAERDALGCRKARRQAHYARPVAVKLNPEARARVEALIYLILSSYMVNRSPRPRGSVGRLLRAFAGRGAAPLCRFGLSPLQGRPPQDKGEYLMNEPITQAQDHDRRIGRLEGIAEQLTEQNRQTNARLDRIEQAIAEQGRRLDATNARLDSLTRWLVGMQIATLLALGTLILARLPG